ncbi:MAG: RNase P subunit p30 family protein [Candidatus Woesearchaeota archaeon]
MIDIVFPDKNENEFIEMAKELDFKKLCFVYPLDKFPIEKYPNTIKAIICLPKDIPKARKKTKLVFIESSESDRHAIEKLPFDILFNLENVAQRDGTHSKRSGLNQVLCELMAKRKKAVALNFNNILNANKGLRSVIIGRMMQNISLCKKFKVKLILASFAKKPYQMRAYHDMIAFGITLGMHPSEAKKALDSIE